MKQPNFKRQSDGKLFIRTDFTSHWVPIVALDGDEEDHIKWYGDKNGSLYASALKGHSYVGVSDDD